jgi:hydrogenase maturation protease
LKKTLILGYGNPDRQDDGAAWHILCGLARRLGRPVPDDITEGFFDTGGILDLVFVLQLTPELAETAAEYERICLIDAHAGSIPEELRFGPVEVLFQASPFTHHLTPQSLLALTKSLYAAEPEAVLATVRGYEFGFGNGLSERTATLVLQADEIIWNWMNQEESI